MTLIRPDGRAYRPRKPGLRAQAWGDDDRSGVIVFGTLDPAAAEPLARQSCATWYDSDAVKKPEPGWYRDSFHRGERRWIVDEKRGMPGVAFTWDEAAA